MRISPLALLLVVACQTPDIDADLPCGPNGECPEGLSCETRSRRCLRTQVAPGAEAPDTVLDSAPPALGRSAAVTFAFHASASGSELECSLDGAGYTACASPLALTVNEGEHAFAARARRGGAVDATPATARFTVDLTAPVTRFTETPPARSGRDVRLAFAAGEAATFACRLDDGAFAACASPRMLAGLAPGAHAFAVRATDEAGNGEEPPAVARWEVIGAGSSVAPDTRFTEAPPARTRAREVAAAFASDSPGVTFECAVDGGAPAPCASPLTLAELAEGGHTLSVRARDGQLVDPTPAQATFALDWTGPTARITGGADRGQSGANVTFTYASDEPNSSFECALDDAPLAPCPAAGQAHRGLLDGSMHRFAVRATDDLGNVGAPATRAFTVNTRGPAITIVSPLPGARSRPSGALIFTSVPGEGVTFSCDLGGGRRPCVSGVRFEGLVDGPHELAVRGTDAAGDVGPEAVVAILVDSIGPEVIVREPAEDAVTASQGTFRYDPADAVSLGCKLDGAELPCPLGGELGYARLADGDHLFTVQGTDDLGNTGAARERRFRVDATGPTITIVAPAAGKTTGAAGVVVLERGDAVRVVCTLGDQPAACDAFADLPSGPARLTAQGFDALENAGPVASVSWTVDADKPAVAIVAPRDVTVGPSGDVVIHVSGAERVACTLDGVDHPCSETGAHYSGLRAGGHRFAISAWDGAGNVAGDEASFTVDDQPPAVRVTAPAAGEITGRAGTVRYQVGDAVRVACTVGGQDVVCDGGGAWAFAELGDGDATFVVRAWDAVDNAAEASLTWRVDAVAPTLAVTAPAADEVTGPDLIVRFDAGDAAAVSCTLDGELVDCDPSGAASLHDLGDGGHDFTVSGRDAHDNAAAPVTRHFLADATGPIVTVTPPPVTGTAGAIPYGIGDAARVVCTLDGAGVACDLGGSWPFAQLPGGAHTLAVEAFDRFDNTRGPVSAGFTVDDHGPDVSLPRPSDPNGVAGHTCRGGSVAFSAVSVPSDPSYPDGDAGFECSSGGVVWAACNGGTHHDFANLGDGSYTLWVRATDRYGNVGAPSTTSWTVGRSSPAVTVSSPAAGATTASAGSFGYSLETNATLSACQITRAGGQQVACAAGPGFAGLSDSGNEHTVTLTATDVCGITSTASRGWNVDTSGPSVGIDAPAAGSRVGPTGTVLFHTTSSEPSPPSYQCWTDSGAAVPCSPATGYGFGPLGAGTHRVTVQGTDAFGNSAGTQVSFVVDPTCAARWVVNADIGVYTAAGDCNAPFKTIGRGLQVARAGETVMVIHRYAGAVYTEVSGETFPLNVPAGVILVGDGNIPLVQERAGNPEGMLMRLGAGATLRGINLSLGSAVVQSQDGVVITGDGATIENCTLSAFNAGVTLGAGATNALLRRVWALSSGTGILFLDRPSSARVESCWVRDNVVGVSIYAASTGAGDAGLADLGGGPLGSAGNNTFECNQENDVYVLNAVDYGPWYYAPYTLFARNDFWDRSPPDSALNINEHCLGADVCIQYSGQLAQLSGYQRSPTHCN